MKIRQSHVPLDSGFPYKGLDSVSPATIMNPSYSPSMLNMVIKDGRPTSRPGYEALSSGLSGTVMLSEEFITADGTKWLVVATTTREYYYDGTTDSYVEVTAGYGTVTEIDHVTGANNDENAITGDFTLVYTSGTNIVVSGCTNSENNGTFTVVSSSEAGGTTTVLVSEDTLVDEGSPPAAARARQERTGSELNMVDFTQGSDSSGTYFFLTNGVDSPRYWNGADDFGLYNDDLITFSGAFVSCKTMEILDTYMVMGGIYTDAEEYRIVAWSDTTDFFLYTGGNSGTNLVSEAIGDIWKLTSLSDRIAIYTQGGSVHLMSHVGQAVLFAWDTILTGLSLVGPRAIVNLGAFHILLSREGFFIFDGTRLLRPYGKELISRFVKDNLSPEFAIRAFGFHDTPNNHAYFVLPTGEDASVTLLLEYDLGDFRNSTWMPLAYTDRPTSMGFYSRHDDLTWDAMDITDWLSWEELAFDFKWSDRSIEQGFPVRVIGAADAVYKAEDTLADDNGVAFTSRWESVELTVPLAFRSSTGRWLEIEGELQGTSVDVEYSVDSGETWTFAGVESDGTDADGVTLTTGWQKLKFLIDVVSDTLIVRLSCPDASLGFSHRDLRVWVIEGGRN